MLVRSATFRYLLAVMIALWSPICLCQMEQTGDGGPAHQNAGHLAAHHDGDNESDDTGHHHDDGDNESDDTGDHHDDCPGHDHKGSGCECPQLTATLAKVDQSIKAGGELTVIVAYPVWSELPAPFARLLGCTRPTAAVPRPSTSLLRMHCALIV